MTKNKKIKNCEFLKVYKAYLYFANKVIVLFGGINSTAFADQVKLVCKNDLCQPVSNVCNQDTSPSMKSYRDICAPLRQNHKDFEKAYYGIHAKNLQHVDYREKQHQLSF